MAEFENHYDRAIRSIEAQLMDTAFRITREGDLAESAFQDTLIKIWKKWPRIVRHPNPKALCLRICINTCYDRLRKANRKSRPLSLGEIPESQAADVGHPDDRYLSEETVGLILKEIAALSRNQRITFHLRVLEDASYGKIAGLLECTEATVRKHMQRARQKLSKQLSYLREHTD